MSAASSVRVIDLFDPLPTPQSKYSDAERKAIIESARQTAKEPLPSHQPLPVVPKLDPVRRWREEADAQTAREAAELERERHAQEAHQHNLERQQRQQQRRDIKAWVERRLAEEREFTIAVTGEVIGEERHRSSEQLEARVKALEVQIAEQRTKHAQELVELREVVVRLQSDLTSRRAGADADLLKAMLSSQRELGTLRRKVDECTAEQARWRGR
jgi:hypothetical protein